MEAKFVDNPAHKLAKGLLFLLPTKCVRLSGDIIVPSELEEGIKFFSTDFPNLAMFETDYSDWVRKSGSMPQLPLSHLHPVLLSQSGC